MRFGLRHFALGTSLAFGLVACGGSVGGGSEPSEVQMKEAMVYAMNHPLGETVSDPIKIVFCKKETCDNPAPQGYRCTFDVKVASRNIGASMYNNISFAFFIRTRIPASGPCVHLSDLALEGNFL